MDLPPEFHRAADAEPQAEQEVDHRLKRVALAAVQAAL